MKGLSSKLIADLNKNFNAGIFFEALIVFRDMSVNPIVKDYFCNFTRPIQFEGNVYQVEPMFWEGSFTLNKTMELPIVQINFANPGREVDAYINDPTVKIRRNTVIQQILHLDDLGTISLYDSDKLQCQVIHSAPNKGTATLFLGWDMRLDDKVPRGTIETDEYPGIRHDIIRAGT